VKLARSHMVAHTCVAFAMWQGELFTVLSPNHKMLNNFWGVKIKL